MPIRRAVLMIRQAISPRFAIRTRLNMLPEYPARPAFPGFAAEQAKCQSGLRSAQEGQRSSRPDRRTCPAIQFSTNASTPADRRMRSQAPVVLRDHGWIRNDASSIGEAMTAALTAPGRTRDDGLPVILFLPNPISGNNCARPPSERSIDDLPYLYWLSEPGFRFESFYTFDRRPSAESMAKPGQRKNNVRCVRHRPDCAHAQPIGMA